MGYFSNKSCYDNELKVHCNIIVLRCQLSSQRFIEDKLILAFQQDASHAERP